MIFAAVASFLLIADSGLSPLHLDLVKPSLCLLPVCMANQDSYLSHACIAVAGQGAAVVLPGHGVSLAANPVGSEVGDHVDTMPALHDTAENEDPNAVLAVQSQGKVTV